jgi:maltose 6'-phosphate phosphatase
MKIADLRLSLHPHAIFMSLLGLLMIPFGGSSRCDDPTETATISLADLGYPQTMIHFQQKGNNWQDSLMTWQSPWLSYDYAQSSDPAFPQPFEFLFWDGQQSWYPGGVGNNFRLNGRSAWLEAGLLYSYDPQQAQKPSDELTILTLNLHTYQETDQLRKFEIIAEVIARLDVDLIAFQECAQSKDGVVVDTNKGIPIRADNMAALIIERLAQEYHLDYRNYFWDWSHYGFEIYEEGLAVIGKSQYPLLDWGSTYVSASQSHSSIDSRKVVYGRFNIPEIGQILLTSAHLSWGSDQLPQLRQTVAYSQSHTNSASRGEFIVGDFNAEPTSPAYASMTGELGYQDAYTEANGGTGQNDPTIGNDSRIDYVFQHDLATGLTPIMSQRLFFDLAGAGQDQAAMERVSDHCAVLLRFKLLSDRRE